MPGSTSLSTIDIIPTGPDARMGAVGPVMARREGGSGASASAAVLTELAMASVSAIDNIWDVLFFLNGPERIETRVREEVRVRREMREE